MLHKRQRSSIQGWNLRLTAHFYAVKSKWDISNICAFASAAQCLLQCRDSARGTLPFQRVSGSIWCGSPWNSSPRALPGAAMWVSQQFLHPTRTGRAEPKFNSPSGISPGANRGKGTARFHQGSTEQGAPTARCKDSSHVHGTWRIWKFATEHIPLLYYTSPEKKCYTKYTIFVLRRLEKCWFESFCNTKFRIFWHHVNALPGIEASKLLLRLTPQLTSGQNALEDNQMHLHHQIQTVGDFSTTSAEFAGEWNKMSFRVPSLGDHGHLPLDQR